MMSNQIKTRQKDSVYSKRYDEKRQAQMIRFNLYADDPLELELLEKIKVLQKNRQLKTVVVQALKDFLEKNENNT